MRNVDTLVRSSRRRWPKDHLSSAPAGWRSRSIRLELACRLQQVERRKFVVQSVRTIIAVRSTMERKSFTCLAGFIVVRSAS